MPSDWIRNRTSALLPAVPITEEVMGSISVCERLYDLLRGPRPGRMLSHIVPKNLLG